MTLISPHQPFIICELVFDKEEWQTIYLVVKNKKSPKYPPHLYDLIRMLATLGGFLNRKNDGEQRVRDFILMQEICLEVNKTYG